MMNLLTKLEKKVLLERLVIGLEEPILVKGIGEVTAKIDSGNSGYNVIHGTNFVQQGDTLLFTTNDKNENNKQVSAKVIDNIDVNMGGNNIERRPVVELDIKFANDEYKKIPFSVTDRSSNNHPILISKTFVENELKALIDVSAKNISQDNIEVDYPINENDSNINRTNNFLEKSAEKAKRFRETGEIPFSDETDTTKKTDNTKEQPNTTTITKQNTEEKKDRLKELDETFVKKVSQCETYNTTDPIEIRKKLAKSEKYKSNIQQINPDNNTLAKKGIQVDLSKIIPFPLFNCLCQKEHIGSKIYINETNQLRESWKSINNKIKNHIDKKAQTPMAEESEEQPATNLTQPLSKQPDNLSDNTNQQEITLTPEEETALKTFINLNQFIVWLIPIGVKTIEETIENQNEPITKTVPIASSYKEVRENFLSYLNSKFDSIMVKAFNGNNINPTSMNNIIQELTAAFIKGNNTLIDKKESEITKLNKEIADTQNKISKIEKIGDYNQKTFGIPGLEQSITKNKDIIKRLTNEINLIKEENLGSKSALFCLAYTEKETRNHFIFEEPNTIVISKKERPKETETTSK